MNRPGENFYPIVGDLLEYYGKKIKRMTKHKNDLKESLLLQPYKGYFEYTHEEEQHKSITRDKIDKIEKEEKDLAPHLAETMVWYIVYSPQILKKKMEVKND